jgi:hypothetical protein
VQVGKFAATDQLNLRHAEVPTAVAAVQPAVLFMPDEPVGVQKLCQQAVLAKQLARLANSQLLTKVCASAVVVFLRSRMRAQTHLALGRLHAHIWHIC